ncbi:MAG: hypothetical protein HUU16_08410 [Candidatus Omnitrophica bacterium]|nr:hypothetical protein [bacterium]NUN96185.1 hypothetical protein [Candidatus Omnitrophota bacterium]
MKLRIQRNSLRLRLTQSEVAGLAERGRIAESIRFGPGEGTELRYELVASEAAPSLTASFLGGVVAVTIPAGRVRDWAGSEEVSLDAQIPLGSEESLKILVEKDFKCLAPRPGEDESDAFPHPKEGCGDCC